VKISSDDMTEKDMRNENIDKYAIDKGVNANGLHEYEMVTRTFVYVGHLAEAREQSYKADQLLLPSEVQATSKDFAEDKLTPFDSSAAKTVAANASSKGDLIAEDSANRAYGDGWQYSNYEVAKKVEYSQFSDKINHWLDTVPHTGNYDETIQLAGTCKVSVEIPYIKEVAARTIGQQHGIYRLFFPKATQKTIDDQIAASQNKGVAVSASQYSVLSGDEKDAKLFIPWVDAMKTWNSFLNTGVNPLSAQSQTTTGSIGDTENPYIGGEPDTIADSCLTQGVNFRDPSVGDLKSEAPGSAFDRMKTAYRQSAIAIRSDGKELWDEAIKTATDKGLNPYLLLAYWGEETNFSSPINPNPKKGLGCGILGEKDAQGHRLSCIQTSTDNNHKQEFLDEFKCFAGSNTDGSCNLLDICSSKTSAYDMIGCYQYGGSNSPGATHLKNLMYFYHLLKGDSAPSCP
jgi:hypothetical protein